MKKKSFLKIGVILSLLFSFITNINASEFILNDDSLIDQRAKVKISQMGAEVKSKLGVNIYIYAKSTLSLNENISAKEKFQIIQQHEKQIIPKLKKPYVLLTMSVEDMHVNLKMSDGLEKIIDKDDILDGYVVPLLASKDKNTLFAKVSASMLNGYAAIADTLAEDKNIELETSIGNAGKVSGTIWRVFMYTLIVLSLIAYTYAVLRKK